jgi:4-diphosphocytidyl-2-C-methyl-D-erythritol kinase
VTATRRIVLRAAAKLNLGLEIIGRRPDGYHDLLTIFQAVEPEDTLTIALAPAGEDRFTVSDSRFDGPDNLAWRALAMLRTRYNVGSGIGIEARLDKMIPAAAGMGGASSDAASALLACRELLDLPASDDELAALGGTLGSDVPFFFRGGTALAAGTGDVLTPLPSPRCWFVIVSPFIEIGRKTATLYAALRPEDFSDGSAVREQAMRIGQGNPLDPTLLVNAFSRPLLSLRADLSGIRDEIIRAGGVPALSGAGPTHYAVFEDREEAYKVAARVRERIGSSAAVFVSAPLPPRDVVGQEGASTDRPH